MKSGNHLHLSSDNYKYDELRDLAKQFKAL
jgi:hypothetical protein